MGRKKSYKIFEMDYLMNNDLSEDDLYYLFETSSLNYSLLINEFKYSNQELTDEKKIIKLVQSDEEWMYKMFWTEKQRNACEKDAKKVFMNIYQCGPTEAESKVQWWILYYGLSNSKYRNNKKIDKMSE